MNSCPHLCPNTLHSLYSTCHLLQVCFLEISNKWACSQDRFIPRFKGLSKYAIRGSYLCVSWVSLPYQMASWSAQKLKSLPLPVWPVCPVPVHWRVEKCSRRSSRYSRSTARPPLRSRGKFPVPNYALLRATWRIGAWKRMEKDRIWTEKLISRCLCVFHWCLKPRINVPTEAMLEFWLESGGKCISYKNRKIPVISPGIIQLHKGFRVRL